MGLTNGEVSLYVHLPWCTSKCPYCDFNSYRIRSQLKEKYYVDSLLKDLEHEIIFSGVDRIGSIYFGGGTPSLFSGYSIRRLIDGISKRVHLKPYAEITLEMNPESADEKNLQEYRLAGINRISIGMQSFSDDVLSALERPHSASDGFDAFLSVRKAGFENINIDLMYGAPQGTTRSDLSDLKTAISLQPEHISWYQLTIEKGTKFAIRAPKLPNEDDIYKSFFNGSNLLSESGYQHYEISAHALSGKISEHNFHYWNYGDYVGIGAGAHGKITIDGKIYRSEKEKHPDFYMRKCFEGGNSVVARTPVMESDALIEFIINATRLVNGFDVNDLYQKTGIEPGLDCVQRKLQRAVKKGFLKRESNFFKPTEIGLRFLNDLQLIFL